MSTSDDESPDTPDTSDSAPTTGIDDDQLPEDLQPGEDNPLAEGLEDRETVDDLMDGGKQADESDEERGLTAGRSRWLRCEERQRRALRWLRCEERQRRADETTCRQLLPLRSPGFDSRSRLRPSQPRARSTFARPRSALVPRTLLLARRVVTGDVGGAAYGRGRE